MAIAERRADLEAVRRDWDIDELLEDKEKRCRRI